MTRVDEVDERVDEVDELEGLREKVRRQEEEIQRLRVFEEQQKNVEEELRGRIECPVCLQVPRQKGPVPVCGNGHIVCRPCRDKIQQEAGQENAKCPYCKDNMGNATSLIASRLVADFPAVFFHISHWYLS